MIIGHKTQWRFLKRAVQLGKLPHALLFYGPSKVGKKTLALEFAKFLNCQAKDFSQRPCQNCPICQAIERRCFPDLILISPQEKEISIDEIRDLSWKMSLKPYSAPWKIAILDSAHSLGKAAQNCFLKTLEEPKEKGIFILVTEYPARLLPTILSRTQKIRFSQVAFLEIEDYLKRKEVGFEKIQRILQFSQGRPGIALECLASEAKLTGLEREIKELESFLQRDLNFRFEYAKKLSEKSLQELNQTFEVWLSYFNQILLASVKEATTSSQNFAQTSKLKKILQAIEKTQILLNFTNINKKLALENLMLHF